LETATISFDIETSDATCPFSVEILLDNTVLLKTDHVQQKIAFSHAMNDDNNIEHELRVVILGKTSEHTKIDQAGNIIKDATLQISNVVVDDIEINQLFLEKCVYKHNFNGTQSDIEDTFHGIAGCNGTISLKFTMPIYTWLLENM
jgi:hypothetical protein